MTGKVYFVGAGPGDPELLTLKALRVLRSADAVLHDDLVSTAILQRVSPAAQVHNVGKRCGPKNITQQEIDFMMTSLATSGLTVVRLKGGEPSIFGRLGEELEALRRAQIDYEIVPGITAAFGAAAGLGIPLTHRNSSHALLFLTGQHASGTPEPEWSKFVETGATLAIYMPGDLSALAEKLRRAGLHDGVACALISHATSQDQSIYVTTLANLSYAPRLASPSLLIVGEVVRFARDASVFDLAALADAARPAHNIAPLKPGASE